MFTLKKTALALCLLLTLTSCNWKTKSVHWDDYVDAQRQFFDRLQFSGTLYVPEPQMLDKLDIDDRVIHTHYRDDPHFFQARLDELHVDLNTVLVRPIPENIRFLAVEEDSPVKLWRLFMLTGNDTATLFVDGIHVRRQGAPERILGTHVEKNNLHVHGEMGTVLWQPVGGGRWRLPHDAWGVVWQVSISTIDEIKKHENRGPLFRVDCDALRQFVQPFKNGVSREMVLKVDVPVSAAERQKSHGPMSYACEVKLR
jgi:hypothetical protein